MLLHISSVKSGASGRRPGAFTSAETNWGGYGGYVRDELRTDESRENLQCFYDSFCPTARGVYCRDIVSVQRISRFHIRRRKTIAAVSSAEAQRSRTQKSRAAVAPKYESRAGSMHHGSFRHLNTSAEYCQMRALWHQFYRIKDKSNS